MGAFDPDAGLTGTYWDGWPDQVRHPPGINIPPITTSPTPFPIVGNWSQDANGAPVYVEFNQQTGVTEYKDAPGGATVTPTFPLSPPAGGGSAGGIETGFVIDNNGVTHFYEYDPATNATSYFDSPGGAATIPTPPVSPTGGTTGGAKEGQFVVDANGTTHWMLVDDNGAATYFDQPGGTATTPVQPVSPASSTPPSVQQTTSYLDIGATAGNVAAGATSVSISNESDATDITVNGGVVAPGKVIEFKAAENNTLGTIAYDASGVAAGESFVTTVV